MTKISTRKTPTTDADNAAQLRPLSHGEIDAVAGAKPAIGTKCVPIEVPDGNGGTILISPTGGSDKPVR